MPLPGPPPLKPHAVRCRWYIAAQRFCGLLGSITISVALVFSSTYSVFVHVLPPSVVMNTPRSAFGPYRWPPTAIHTVFGSRGWTMRRPSVCAFLKPMLLNVYPPSVLLYSPSPYDVVCRLLASPVAT